MKNERKTKKGLTPREVSSLRRGLQKKAQEISDTTASALEIVPQSIKSHLALEPSDFAHGITVTLMNQIGTNAALGELITHGAIPFVQASNTAMGLLGEDPTPENTRMLGTSIRKLTSPNLLDQIKSLIHSETPLQLQNIAGLDTLAQVSDALLEQLKDTRSTIKKADTLMEETGVKTPEKLTAEAQRQASLMAENNKKSARAIATSSSSNLATDILNLTPADSEAAYRQAIAKVRELVAKAHEVRKNQAESAKAGASAKVALVGALASEVNAATAAQIYNSLVKQEAIQRLALMATVALTDFLMQPLLQGIPEDIMNQQLRQLGGVFSAILNPDSQTDPPASPQLPKPSSG
jgi:hypothetical protein